MVKELIISDAWIKSIAEQLNIDPGETNRIVIDAMAGKFIVIYVEKFGTKKMLDIKIPPLAEVEIRVLDK